MNFNFSVVRSRWLTSNGIGFWKIFMVSITGRQQKDMTPLGCGQALTTAFGLHCTNAGDSPARAKIHGTF